MSTKQKLMTGVRVGAVMIVGSLLIGTACRKCIEYYRKRTDRDAAFEEESL